MEIVNTKENFYNSLDNLLISKGLQRDNNDIWVKDFEVQGRGMTMSINGQQFQQAGEVIKMKYFVEVIGEGSVGDEPFFQINFQVHQGDDIIIDADECIYFEEIELVRNIVNQIFR